MRRILSLFTLLMLCGVLAHAQSRVVTGKIADKDGNPIPFATVKIKGSNTGVSADGSQLWLSGRFDSEVYVFDTSTGTLTARIKVPPGPHGLNVFPQPGRYSLGHTENYR